jgi:membrane-associated phospholipid phosphatase
MMETPSLSANSFSPRPQGAAGRAPAIRSSRRAIFFVALWILATIVSASLDIPVSNWLHARGIDAIVDHSRIAKAVKFGGEFYFLAAIALVLGFRHTLRWQAAGFLCLCGIVSGVNGLVKWIVGRTRPFKGFGAFDFQPFRNGLAGAFDQKNLCFPSGHACLAFATAAGLAILLPRWRWAFYVAATLVAIERVTENAHYVSDCVGAAAIGVIGVWIIAWICRKMFPQKINP